MASGRKEPYSASHGDEVEGAAASSRNLRPILVENDGWALFIYTPRGRNHGHATYLRALEADTWFCEKLTVDDTGLITPAQIEEERRAGMSDGKIGQEFFCSFDADIDEQLISHDLVSAAMARQAHRPRPGRRR